MLQVPVTCGILGFVTTHPAWDARGYDDRFSFVTAYGADRLELLAVRSGERILDIGCGTGHQCAHLAAACADVLGTDADIAMITAAQVLSNAALHWMPQQDAVIAAMARAL